MLYSAFKLVNYRCFKTEQELEIAIPDGEKTGSGLTCIVGENDVGKTSLLEAMQFKDGDLLRAGGRMGVNDAASFIYLDENRNVCRTLVNEAGHYVLLSPDHSATQDSLPFFVPSRRYWQTRVQNGGPNTEWLVGMAKTNRLRMATEMYTDMDVAALLKNIEKDKDLYDELVRAVRMIIPNFGGYAVTVDDYEYVEYTSGGDRYKSSFSGDGISSLIRIVANVISADDRPIVIDEPELSLHPDAKRKLAKFLGEYSSKRQIILSTHDPYFISWHYIENGAKINRLVKDCETNTTTIHHLGEPEVYESLLRQGENWQKPQMLDLLSKEIFFYDDVLFLEGQEDVGLFRKEGLLSDVNIYGYGIGGFNSAEAALKLAHDLGIRKAATIIDGGVFEDVEVDRLRGLFRRYKIIQWDKNDIRDKIKDDELIKEGYFDCHGNLKPEDELGDFREKITTLEAYFSN